MSEQKMPALPCADECFYGHLYWRRDSIERIRAEAVEFGRQQERERLEPLRVAVDAYRAERLSGTTNSERKAADELYVTAYVLLELTE